MKVEADTSAEKRVTKNPRSDIGRARLPRLSSPGFRLFPTLPPSNEERKVEDAVARQNFCHVTRCLPRPPSPSVRCVALS